MRALLEHARVAMLLGLRSHTARAVVGLGIVLLVTAFLSGAFSLRQPLIVTLDVGFSGVRGLIVLLVLFWIQDSFVRDIDRKAIFLVFSFPVSRDCYVIGRLFGILGLLGFAILFWGGALYLLDQVSDWGYALSSRPIFGFGYLLVLGGVFLDGCVIAAFVLMVVSLSETPLLPFLVGAGFALGSRLLGPTLDYLQAGALVDPNIKEHFLPILEKVRWVLPELARLDWRGGVLYGAWPPVGEMMAAVSMAVGYFVVFVVVAVSMYRRREFN